MINKLNEEQKKIVNSTSGPLLVVAGAGTGKTTTIVSKIANLIENNLTKPHEIVSLTFTEKAASEMEQRIDIELPMGVFGVTASTFHSFAEQILREECHQIGLDPNFKILNESGKIYFLKKNIYDTSLKNINTNPTATSTLESVLAHYSRLQDEFISPEEYINWVKSEKIKIAKLTESEKNELVDDIKNHEILSEGYAQFLELKKQNQLVDFADLVYFVIKIFKEKKSVLAKYQNKFKYFFVDEFQDTNLAQYELIKLLCPPEKNPNLTVVGDDSQGIYKFRGATVSNILNFKNDYKNAVQVILNDNYRSAQPILDAAYKLIKNNDPDTLEFRLGISKKLISHTEEVENAIFCKQFYQGKTEANFIAKEIKRLMLEENINPSEIAILTRARSHQEPIKQALAMEEIPYQVSGSDNFFKQKEVRDLISLLQIIINPQDSQALHRVLSMSLVDINMTTLYKIESLSKDLVTPLFYTLEILKKSQIKEFKDEKILKIVKKHNILEFEDLSKVFNLLDLIYELQGKTRDHNAGQIIYLFLERMSWLAKIKNIQQNSLNISTEDNNISKFFNFLESLKTKINEIDIESVVEFLKIIEEKEDDVKNDDFEEQFLDGVQILTVHASKGLEFYAVFIPSLSETRFPSRSKSEKYIIPEELIKDTLPTGDSHIQEERRLFYVGITRAKKKLYLSSSGLYGKNIRRSKPSRFLVEALDENIIEIDKSIEDEKNQLSIFDFKKPEEPEIIVKNDEELNLSYSKINDYEICPLKYKYKNVLNVPYESKNKADLGNTIHLILQKFYKLQKEGIEVNENVLINLLHETFKNSGFESVSEMKHEKEKVKDILMNFYKFFHKKDAKILDLEKSFKIKITEKVNITGKIDRLDEIGDGVFEIIDYKSGKTKTEKEMKKDLQLSIYAYALKNDSRFKKDLENIKLSYYFLKEKEPISVIKTETEIKESINKIIEVSENIRNNNFEAKTGRHCDMCEFKKVCNAWPKI